MNRDPAHQALSPTHQWNAQQIELSRSTALPSPQERDLILHLNLVRSNPSAYARIYIEPRLGLYMGKVYANPLSPRGSALRTLEGAPAAKEAVQALLETPPMGTLTVSSVLNNAAADHALDQSNTGATGHMGSDGSDLAQRIQRHGIWRHRIAEVISYGPISGSEVISRLLIDDGVPSRGHRKNILNPRLHLVGIAIAPHPRFGHVVVIDMAEVVTEGTNP